ncbi:MAG: DUF6785 family protein [Capsulimonadales bacterium]|nr:DUF6785 family protein [Capsulimonadales bacterium]
MATSTGTEGAGRTGVTPRALLLGVVFTVLVDLWIHYAELVMGGAQGHTAIAATSTPVGPFFVLLMLSALNLLGRHLMPSLALSGGELLVVYSMIASSAVLSSSGQLHFIIPTVTAAFHYATGDNAWAGTFHRFIPDWIAQKHPQALSGFYKGGTTPDWPLWLPQMGAWIGFMLSLAFATLCLTSLLRRLWVERERLAFPTVQLPLALMEERVPLFRNPLFLIGAAIPFAFSIMNTLALNDPRFPLVSLRADTDLAVLAQNPPWNRMGRTALSFYPFVLGIAYLIPVDVTFSSWFFFLVTRAENLIGVVLNIDAGMTGSPRATFPFIGEQGAGAFVALALVPIWLNRSYFREIWNKAFGERSDLDDSDEPLSYRAAFLGLLAGAGGMILFCAVAGMHPIVAAVLVFFAFCNMVAATRIRAETGNAWLFGPNTDINQLMTRTFGTSSLTPQDLTVLAYLRPAIANFDLRCMVMPHQFDAMKMADSVGVSRRRLFGAICFGTVIGLTASFVIALILWHHYGAEAKTDAWRTSQGRVPFDTLVSLLRNPNPTDWRGVGAVGMGLLITAGLMLLRAQFVWWPLHPVGYAIANTNTMESTWMPFFIAWLLKLLALRYGGAPLYRKSVPFFLGLIAGDLLGGGLTTLIGAFTGINVYPINW